MESDKSLDEKTQRVRSLLASYYSLDEGGEGGVGSGGVGSSHDTPGTGRGVENLDREGFDCQRYFDRLLETNRLDELLTREIKLQSEVKQCDGELQSLVYENYSKFIAATDTIRSMRTKVDGMESKMALVKDKIGRIAEKNAVVDGKMEQRRARFDELNTVRNVMSKLNEVFDLPDKCRLSMERGALEVAVRYIASSKPFLEIHGSGENAALARVKAKLEACQLDLVASLKEKLRTDPDNNVEVINFLRQLGETVTELEDTFLSSSGAQLREMLQRATAAFEDGGCMGDLCGDEVGRAKVDEALAGIEDELVPCVLKLQSQYRGMFLSDENGAALGEGAGKFDATVESVLASAVAAAKKFVLTHPVKTLVAPSVLLEVLGKVSATFGRVEERFSSFEDVWAGFAQCMECSVRNFVGAKFLGLEGELRGLSSGEGAEARDSVAESVSAATEAICGCFDSFLHEMREMQKDGGPLIDPWKESFVGLVEEGCHQTLAAMQDALKVRPSPTRPQFFLFTPPHSDSSNSLFTHLCRAGLDSPERSRSFTPAFAEGTRTWSCRASRGASATSSCGRRHGTAGRMPWPGVLATSAISTLPITSRSRAGA